jgi:hypothetical protein
MPPSVSNTGDKSLEGNRYSRHLVDTTQITIVIKNRDELKFIPIQHLWIRNKAKKDHRSQ